MEHFHLDTLAVFGLVFMLAYLGSKGVQRLNAQDDVEGGLILADAEALALALVELGADAVTDEGGGKFAFSFHHSRPWPGAWAGSRLRSRTVRA